MYFLPNVWVRPLYVGESAKETLHFTTKGNDDESDRSCVQQFTEFSENYTYIEDKKLRLSIYIIYAEWPLSCKTF